MAKATDAEPLENFGAEPGQDPPEEPTVGDPPPEGEEGLDGTENLPVEVEATPVVSAPAGVQVLNPLDMPTDQFKAGLDRRRTNREALMKWLKKSLVRDTDFGSIHVVSKDKCQAQKNCKIKGHWSKDTLFKPGSEKILGQLGLIVDFPTLQQYEDAAISGAKIDNIILRCEIKDPNGRVVGKGIGARRCQKQDYGDINKSLKMAKKSGMIDATLTLAGLSELFTQDMDDMPDEEEIKRLSQPDPAQAPPPQQPPPQRRQAPAHSGGGSDGNYVTEPMRKAIWASIKNHFVMAGVKDNNVVNEFAHWCFGVQSMNFIPFDMGKQFLDTYGRDKETKKQRDHEGFKKQIEVFESEGG